MNQNALINIKINFVMLYVYIYLLLYENKAVTTENNTAVLLYTLNLLGIFCSSSRYCLYLLFNVYIDLRKRSGGNRIFQKRLAINLKPHCKAAIRCLGGMSRYVEALFLFFKSLD